MAMANPSSIPVRNKTITTARPKIPIVTSLIFPSGDFQDITQEHKALNKTADSQCISNGIERHGQRWGDFSCLLQIHSIHYQIPADHEKESYSQASCKNIKNIPYFLGESWSGRIRIVLSLCPGRNEDRKADHD